MRQGAMRIFGGGCGSADDLPQRMEASHSHHLMRDPENHPPAPGSEVGGVLDGAVAAPHCFGCRASNLSAPRGIIPHGTRTVHP